MPDVASRIEGVSERARHGARQGFTSLRVALEQHFVEVEGWIYTDIAFGYDYWREYLAVFESVHPIARVRVARDVPDGWIRADGPGVHFHRVYDYRGFWRFLGCFPRVIRDCRRALAGPGPVLLRTGNISLMCWLNLVLSRRPYAIEVVGHAGEGAATVPSIRRFGLGRVIAGVLHQTCRIQAWQAECASYVSEFVQRLYPTGNGREWVFSGVKLTDGSFGRPRQRADFGESPLRIISVGRIEREKGHHVAVEAVALLARRNVPVRLSLVGPGSQIEPLRQLANHLGIADRVQLLGLVPPGDRLQALLRDNHLFVLPSLTEGMPRALLEAMATGLPAIGSSVGGVVEILDPDALVPPNYPQALADRIATLARSPDKMAALSARGFATTQQYRKHIMDERKRAFWYCLAERSARDDRPPSGRSLCNS